MIDLTWPCPYCGLETPAPETHLREAHNVSIEKVIADMDTAAEERKALERLLLAVGEMTGIEVERVCPECGRPLEEET